MEASGLLSYRCSAVMPLACAVGQRRFRGEHDPVAHRPTILIRRFLDRRVQLRGETQGDPYVAFA